MKVAFYTLGCKVNHYETQAMEELFRKAGHEVVPVEEKADAYIVNTCSVTSVSDKKSRQILSQAHRKNPDALIAAVGCYAEVAKDAVSALPGVSLGTRILRTETAGMAMLAQIMYEVEP